MHKTYTLTHPNYKATGRFFWQETDFEDPGICFVPEACIEEGKLNETLYLRRWARINCGSQPQGYGSHMFPDLEKPVLEETPEEKRRVQELLKKWA